MKKNVAKKWILLFSFSSFSIQPGCKCDIHPSPIPRSKTDNGTHSSVVRVNKEKGLMRNSPGHLQICLLSFIQKLFIRFLQNFAKLTLNRWFQFAISNLKKKFFLN